MPRSTITGTIVSYVWDDESITELSIKRGKSNEKGHYISIYDGNDEIYIYPDCWRDIKDSIENMLFEIDKEDNE